jgi:hypothetical protein
MPANLGREIDRALTLQKTLNVLPSIYGGRVRTIVSMRSRRGAVPVLVNLNWPKEEKNRDPDAETPLRTLIHRKLAPTTPAALSRRGRSFAFYRADSRPRRRFSRTCARRRQRAQQRSRARGAVVNPAAILGVSKRLGTIEKGKVANLVARDPNGPWADGRRSERPCSSTAVSTRSARNEGPHRSAGQPTSAACGPSPCNRPAARAK